MTPISKILLKTAMASLFFMPSLAHAELKSQMQAFVVSVDQAGSESLSPAASVKPGQIIEYRLVHTNGFENAINGVAIVGPVPQGSELLVDNTSSDVQADFEVRGEFDPDRPGEEWSALPAQRIVIAADGTRMIEDATAEHFTAVRWKLGAAMQRDATVQHAYRVRVQ